MHFAMDWNALHLTMHERTNEDLMWSVLEVLFSIAATSC